MLSKYFTCRVKKGRQDRRINRTNTAPRVEEESFSSPGLLLCHAPPCLVRQTRRGAKEEREIVHSARHVEKWLRRKRRWVQEKAPNEQSPSCPPSTVSAFAVSVYVLRKSDLRNVYALHPSLLLSFRAGKGGLQSLPPYSYSSGPSLPLYLQFPCVRTVITMYVQHELGPAALSALYKFRVFGHLPSLRKTDTLHQNVVDMSIAFCQQNCSMIPSV